MPSEKNFGASEKQDAAILLVEDDGADIVLIRRAFRNARIANPLIEVRDGHAAIQYLSGEGVFEDRIRHPIPFLVLLDLRLPKLSGFEVLEWIRERPNFSEMIVVVLTASDYIRDVNRSHEMGANSYLVKPGTFEELVELVRQIEGRWLLAEQITGDSAPEEFPRRD